MCLSFSAGVAGGIKVEGKCNILTVFRVERCNCVCVCVCVCVTGLFFVPAISDLHQTVAK